MKTSNVLILSILSITFLLAACGGENGAKDSALLNGILDSTVLEEAAINDDEAPVSNGPTYAPGEKTTE